MAKNEQIAVIPYLKLRQDIPLLLEGVSHIPTSLFTYLQQHAFPYNREAAENDPTYKQIVSYCVAIYKKSIFVTQRQSTCSEQRLKNKYSCGIGGHLTIHDLSKDPIEWGLREWEEEVIYPGTKHIIPYGVINDNSNPVGQVHLGICFLVFLNQPTITVRTELKSGTWLSLGEIAEKKSFYESWSNLLLPLLHDSIH